MHPQLTVLSLFAGAGGLDYGLKAAGFRTTAALEMDSRCCETLRKNDCASVVNEKSIHDTTSAELLDHVGEVDLIVGGPPCQPFSKSGYWATGDSKRLEDPRAETLSAFMRVVRDLQPHAFLLENVAGLVFDKKREGLDLLFDMIDEINEEKGTHYRPSYKVLRAADYGVPQQRERFFMVAARSGLPFHFPAPSFGPESSEAASNGVIGYRTAWDAIGGLNVVPGEDLQLRGKWADLLPSIPEGENYLWHTDRGGGVPIFGWRRRYWSFLLKLAKALPSWTIQAQPGPATGPFHWDNRRLSMRELCRLQTFPDSVEVTGNLNAVQRQVGNAVPSLLAETLGYEIRRQFFGHRGSYLVSLLPPLEEELPLPLQPAPVPDKYRALIGKHAAHPGTGKGYSAEKCEPSPLRQPRS